MATENLILDEKRKAQLDENLKAMSENGVDNESIIAYANDFKSKYGSPKSTAPSMQGGESGAVKTPSTSTSVLEDLESGSWTQKISPQAPKPAIEETEQYPLVKKQPQKVKNIPSNFGEILEKSKIGVINPDLAVETSKPIMFEGKEISIKKGLDMPMSVAKPKPKQEDIDDLVKRTTVLRNLRESEKEKAKQLENGIKQLEQKGAQLNEQYKISPNPALYNQLTQTVKDLQDTERAYNKAAFAQDVYEKRIIQVSDSIRKLANDAVPDNFYTGLYQGFKQNIESWGGSYDLAKKSKAEQIQYAKEQALKTPSKEPSTSGMIGSMIGGVLPDMGAAIGFSLVGLPSVGATSVAVRQGAQQAAEDFVRAFNQAKEKGIDTGDKYDDGSPVIRQATDDEAYDIATKAAGIGAATGFAEGMFAVTPIGGIATKAAVGKAKTLAGKVAAEKIVDTALDASVAATMQTGRNIYDRYQGLDTQVTEGVLENAAGEVFLSAPTNIISGVKEYGVKKKEEAVREVFRAINDSRRNPYELNKLQNNLDILKSQGMISEKDYNELNQKAEQYIKAVEKIPDTLKEDSKKIAADLIIEKEQLEEKKKTIDKAFHKGIDARIEAINKKLESIAETATQEQPEVEEKPEIDLQKYTGATNEKYGYIDRGDGKGKVELTKEEFETEQAKMQPKAEEEVIGDEEFSEFQKTKSVTPERISAIAEKINNGEKLSTRENKIVAYKKAEIKAELEKKGLESQEAETAVEETETQPTTTEQVEEVKLAELPTKTIQAEVVEEKPKPTKNEQETKKENGEPMPTGVQGVRTEGEGGQESTELRTQEEEVTPQAGSVVGGDAEMRKKEIKSENDRLIKHKRELDNDRYDVVTGEGKYKNFGKKERDARLEEIRNEVKDIDSKQEALQKELKVIEAKETGSVELFDHPSTNHGSTNTIIYDIKNDKLVERENVVRGKTKDISIEDAAKQKFERTLRGRNQREINEAYTDKIKAKYEAEITDEIAKYKQSLQSTPTTQEKVSGGLTQEEKTNLETIAKEAGVNFQEVRNVYNKYGEGKPLSEITLEDYQKAQEKRDKGKEGKFNQSASEFNVGDIIVDKIGVVFKVLKIGKAFTKVQNLSDTGIPNKIEEFANVYKGFEKSNLTEKQAEEKRNKETPALTKSEKEQLDSLNRDIEATLDKIENLESDIEIEKGNLKEEKQRIKDEIAKVRESSMSKAEKAERIEELKAELQDIIDSIEDTIEINKDEIAAEKADLKKYEKQKAKLEQKKQAAKEAKTEEGAPTITVEEEKQKPQLPKTRKERLDSLREKAKKLKGAKPVSSAVGAVMTKAREALNWIKQKAGVKEEKISQRNDLVKEAAQRLQRGEITNEEYRAIRNENSPVTPITIFFDPATGEQVRTSVRKDQEPKANLPVKNGRKVGLRLDLPAFNNNNVWVISVHDGSTKGGAVISYKNVARITNVVFSTQSPASSLNIAAGGQKQNMVGRAIGEWVELEGETEEEKGETAKKLVEEIANDPSWVQVGINPYRNSFFYDRSSQLGRPVLSADDLVQIGGLVYAKNVKYGNWTDEAFRVKGLLDKAGKPVQFSKGKRMSDVENFISSSIEEGYPLDEVSEIVQEMWGKSEAEANKLIDKYKPTKTTKNAIQEPSTERKVSPTGEGRKDITEGGEGVGQGKQGEKSTQEGVQEKIDALVDKSLPASERRKIMQENPLIKRIFDNIKELHKQLEEKGLITKEGNCP